MLTTYCGSPFKVIEKNSKVGIMENFRLGYAIMDHTMKKAEMNNNEHMMSGPSSI